MADRMIREGLLTSARVAKLSFPALVFFIFLKLQVDDNGVHPADPQLLRARCFPTRPQVRASDIVRWIAECEKADLLLGFDASDGTRYVIVLRFGQKMKWHRAKYPLPATGAPDVPGQVKMFEATDPPPIRREEKRSVCETRAPRARPDHTPTLELSQFAPEKPADYSLAALSQRWPGIDIETELAATTAYLRKTRGAGAAVDMRWFEEHWLRKVGPKIIMPVQPNRAVVAAEPEGWRAWLNDERPDSVYAHGGSLEGTAWGALDDTTRNFITAQLGLKGAA